MTESSRNEDGDGWARARTDPGPPYQVPRCTASDPPRPVAPAAMPGGDVVGGRSVVRGRTMTGSRGKGPYHRAMSPKPRPVSDARARRRRRSLRGRLALAGAVFVLLASLGGCAATFDPHGPCSGDGSAPGSYRELEALVPTTFRGTRPHQLDSGRTCTPDGLGTLAGHGISEMRFAGATWETGNDSGVTLATFATPAGPTLTEAWLAEFYEGGAAAGKHVASVVPSDYQVATGINGHRIDVLNDESFQTVVVWERKGQVQVALVGDFIREIQTREAHDAVVREAVDAWLATG